VESDGHLVKIALPVDAGGIDELLVVGGAIGCLQVLEVGEGSDGFEIEVDDAVGLREEAGGLRRGLGAQEDGHGQH
jgi:hypothetical protein